jgi:hypothetical protein
MCTATLMRGRNTASAAGVVPATGDGVANVNVPRSPTTGVLFGVVRTHLTEFLAAATDGPGPNLSPLARAAAVSCARP